MPRIRTSEDQLEVGPSRFQMIAHGASIAALLTQVVLCFVVHWKSLGAASVALAMGLLCTSGLVVLTSYERTTFYRPRRHVVYRIVLGFPLPRTRHDWSDFRQVLVTRTAVGSILTSPSAFRVVIQGAAKTFRLPACYTVEPPARELADRVSRFMSIPCKGDVSTKILPYGEPSFVP